MCQEKPSINKNSEKIAKEIGHRPIYLRVEEMMDKKRLKQENIEIIKKQKEE